MNKQLHFAGEDINLPDDVDLEQLQFAIDEAGGGSWIDVTDIRGALHHLRVTPAVPIRLSASPKAVVGVPKRLR